MEIDRENTNLNQMNRKHIEENIFNAKELEEPSQTSTTETIKELALEKEDSKMKKIIAQMTVMKQIQKKREENQKLELALKKLVERRKIIHAALEKQKQVAEEKRKNAGAELQRQMEVMASREKLILKLRNQEKDRDRQRGREQPNMNRQQSGEVKPVSRLEEKFDKADMLEAHKLLVDKSNQRILSRIEEIKLARRAEAIAEQESFLAEQQLAINLLRQLQLQRDYRVQTPLQMEEKPTKPPSLSQRLKKAKDTLLLNPADKKQVMEWMDLEKNSAILHKTDRAIAEKLRAENSNFDSSVDYYDEEYTEDYSEDYGEYDDDDIDDILGLKNIESLMNSDFSTMLDVEASPSFIDLDFNDDLGSRPAPQSERNVRTKVKRFPNGRVSTSVSIGIETPRPRMERTKISSPRRLPQSFSSLMMSQ